MAKLKLSGRKLCTTGRKLAVCGCGGGGPCCAALLPCEVLTGTSGPFNFKSWWKFTASGQRSKTPRPDTGSCAGAAFSGSYTASALAPALHARIGPGDTNDYYDLSGAGTCYVTSIGQRRTALSSIAPDVPPTNPGTLTGNLTGALGSTEVDTAAWSMQPPSAKPPGVNRINFNYDLSATSVSAPNPPNESGGVAISFSLAIIDGVVSVTNKTFGATVTPYLLKEGNCILGAGASFTITYNFYDCGNADGSRTPLANHIISGTVATVICGVATGCTNPGTLCQSATPPGANGLPTLIDQLDQALFS